MPYDRRADLPVQVQDHLPVHAQDTCKEAFNSARDEYEYDESRVHALAWAAL